MQPGRILIVDDDPLARAAAAAALHEDEHEVQEAADGASGLRALEAAAFDVVVTDVMMPGLGGLELLDLAKRLRPDLDVIVLTGMDSVDTAVRAMRGGAWHYLVKPFSPEALRLDVRRCLERRRLLAAHAELTRHAELYEASQRLTTCMEADRLHGLALDLLRARVGGTAGVLSVPDPSAHGELCAAAARGLDPEQGEWLVETLRGHHAAAFEGRAPTLIGGIARLIPSRVEGLRRLQHALVVPLAGETEEPLGVAVLLAEGQGFGPEEVRDAAFLGRCVSLALGNARQYEAARDRAGLDGLTGLRNASALDTVLDHDLERRARSRAPLSVIFMDLDLFRTINAAHGREAGHRVLAEVGHLLRRHVRESDLLVRSGDDEFVAVLRDTPGHEALALAEKVRREVEGHTFLADEGAGVRLTLSAGVSTWPDNAADRSALLQQSDAAMYHAKRNHRNAVYAYPEIVLGRDGPRQQSPSSDRSTSS